MIRQMRGEEFILLKKCFHIERWVRGCSLVLLLVVCFGGHVPVDLQLVDSGRSSHLMCDEEERVVCLVGKYRTVRYLRRLGVPESGAKATCVNENSGAEAASPSSIFASDHWLLRVCQSNLKVPFRVRQTRADLPSTGLYGPGVTCCVFFTLQFSLVRAADQNIIALQS